MRTDCPTTLSLVPALPEARPAAEEIARLEAMPLPEHGNLPSFLANALKIDMEVSSETGEDRGAAIARRQSVKTRGDARRYIEYVIHKAEHAREQLRH